MLYADFDKYDIETIIKPLLTKEIDIYQLLDGFISFQQKKGDLAIKTRVIHLTIVKSYLTYHDVDIVPDKFRHRVTRPKLYREDEEALSVEDIRKLLLACGNRRLKAYMFFLLSGARATEALSVQNRGVDFTTSPAKIHIRKESLRHMSQETHS
jgi:integrase